MERLFLLIACATLAAGAAPSPAPSQALAQLFEDFFEAQLELEPLLATSIGDTRHNDRLPMGLSAEERAKAEALYRRSLERLEAIDPTALSEADRLSYEVFRSAQERALEATRFPAEWLLPVNQARGLPILFAQLGSGKGLHPFRTAKDYDDFLKRAEAYSLWVGQAIAAMREGMRTGYVQPRVIIEKALPPLAAHVVDKPEDSLFWGPVAAFPASLEAAEKERLTAAYRRSITDTIVPAYRRLHAFLLDEYLPKVPGERRHRRVAGRQGVLRLPRAGVDDHAAHARPRSTNWGWPRSSVSTGDIRALMQRLKFEGDPAGVLHSHEDRSEVPLGVLRQHVRPRVALEVGQVDAALPRLFETLPKAFFLTAV